MKDPICSIEAMSRRGSYESMDVLHCHPDSSWPDASFYARDIDRNHDRS